MSSRYLPHPGTLDRVGWNSWTRRPDVPEDVPAAIEGGARTLRTPRSRAEREEADADGRLAKRSDCSGLFECRVRCTSRSAERERLDPRSGEHDPAGCPSPVTPFRWEALFGVTMEPWASCEWLAPRRRWRWWTCWPEPGGRGELTLRRPCRASVCDVRTALIRPARRLPAAAAAPGSTRRCWSSSAAPPARASPRWSTAWSGRRSARPACCGRPPGRRCWSATPPTCRWFAEGQLLPGLTRTTGAERRPAARCSWSPRPRSAPGWPSSTRPTSTRWSTRNRALAAQLLAAADLWLFVTTAARTPTPCRGSCCAPPGCAAR